MRVESGDETSSMLSGHGGLILEVKCLCARKTWHEREVGVFLKWAYFRETMVYNVAIYILCMINVNVRGYITSK